MIKCYTYKEFDQLQINELIEQYKDMPVATTQMLMLADFQGQVGWATSYGKTMLNPFMYASGKIINFA